MRVLQVNKYHQITSGGDRFFFDTVDILRSNGHEVIPFCLDYKGNRPTKYEAFFPPGVAGRELAEQGLLTKAKLLVNGIYSLEARRALGRLLDVYKPDIAHLHILHYAMSPSVVDELARRNVPIVFSLHDYRIGCAGAYLFRSGQQCTACARHRYYRAVIHRCYRNSLAASLMASMGNALHAVKRTYDKVAVFTVPHEEMRQLVALFGVPAEKVEILRNPLRLTGAQPEPVLGDYALYFGNLLENKGLLTLLKAAALVRHITFVICGSGELLERMQAEIRDEKLTNVRIDTTTRLGSGLEGLIAGARCIVLPSEWPSPLEYSTLEAMAFGKAILAARAGGNATTIQDGKTGLLFRVRDAQDLASKVARLFQHDDITVKLGMCAREQINSEFSEARFTERLLAIYSGAMGAISSS